MIAFLRLTKNKMSIIKNKKQDVSEFDLDNEYYMEAVKKVFIDQKDHK